VCYAETGPFQKLCCGHVFCKGCIKNWYLKGASGSSCPMCRRPVYWRGFHKVREEWEEEAYEHKCAEVFSQALDDAFEEAQDFAEQFSPIWRAHICRGVIEDFIDIEKTYRFMKWHDALPDDMEEVFYYGDYYSDRRIHKYTWDNEPPREFLTRYPLRKDGVKGGKRCRARQDEWFEMTVCVLL
jgi:Zinc finger, C3HC4 type (RING finger)